MSAIYDWATVDNLQPESITVEIWKKLPENYCREVEVVNGDAVRAESPTRPHQKAARRIADMVETAAEAFMRTHRGTCFDVDTDFDVVLYEVPATTIRRPDVALIECAPENLRPLPASMVKIAIEVVSPGTEKVDVTEKKAEYAAAGIPWCWLVWVAGNEVTSIEVHVLDHAVEQYRPHAMLEPGDGESTIDVPVRVKIDWTRLGELVR